MTRRASARLSAAGVLLLATLAVAGCGRVGAPVAPERRVPAPATELTGLIRNHAIELTWRTPAQRVDGTPLRTLALTRLFRAEDAGTGDPRPALLSGGRIPGYVEIAAIDLIDPAPPASVGGDRVAFVDRGELTYGRRYTYVVVTVDETGRVSPPSRRLSLVFIAPPVPPTSLAAEAGEGQARLSWDPPLLLADGKPIAGQVTYEVLRAAGADVPLAPIAVTAEPRFTDHGVANDQTYYYAVRAIHADAGAIVYGEPSAPTSVTPRDLTPPAPPTDLVAFPSEGAVRLSWKPSPDPKATAYVVYRADARGDFVRMGSTRAPVTTFIDRGVAPGRYRYVVTAQDSNVRPNESGRSNEVDVAVP